MKDLLIVKRDFLGLEEYVKALLMIPIHLFAFNMMTKIYKLRCFWHNVQATGTVLKVVVGWLILLVFLENITSCTCLDKSGLKIIFHLYAQSDVLDLYLIDQPIYINELHCDLNIISVTY